MTTAVETLRAPRPGRPGAWAVSGVLAVAFSNSPLYRGMPRSLLRLLMVATALTGEWRVNSEGTAVCFINTPARRSKLIMWGLTGATIASLLILLAVPWPGWVGVAVLAVAMVALWSLRRVVKPSWASMRAQRKLRGRRPAGPTVLLHSVASVEPGAGARLLRAVGAEADRRGWTLVLDAANEQLVAKVYRPVGFEVTGEPVAMPWGDRRVPMARFARPEGGSCG